MSLSEQKQALRSADSFFIWRSLRCGGVQRREGEREIGGGVGARGGEGGWGAGVGGLCFCYERSV